MLGEEQDFLSPGAERALPHAGRRHGCGSLWVSRAPKEPKTQNMRFISSTNVTLARPLIIFEEITRLRHCDFLFLDPLQLFQKVRVSLIFTIRGFV